MKFTIEQPALSAGLSRVLGVVEKRNTIPILSNVLICALDGQVTITATDMDIEVSTSVPADVQTPGDTTVSADMLNSIVKRLSKGKLIQFEADDKQASIKSGRSDLQLGVLESRDFPILANTVYETQFTADQSDIKRLFDITAFAMSSDEVRYYLQGVYLHDVDGQVKAVSTDGHRLALADSDLKASFPGVIIPRKVVNHLRGLLADDTVDVSISETKVKFNLGHTTLVAKVIDGSFPDYTRIFPEHFAIAVSADATELKRAGELVSQVSNERTKGVMIKLADGLIALEVNGGVDKGREEIEVDYDGEEFSLGVNSKYFAEILQQCNGADATLHFNDRGSPIKITSSDDDNALWICMPMRVV